MRPGVTLQLFAKAPVAGTVKTRLLPVLSAQDAATLHARMVEHAAGVIAAAGAAIPQSRAELWCSPDMTDATLRAIALRHGLALRQQPEGDVGMRMEFALQSAMPGRTLLLGSDCPLLDAPLLIGAYGALDAHDAVFVPVEDGGYALVGCRDRTPDCFAGIAWSTGQVMAQTRARLHAAGNRWLELPLAWDVDRAADLARLGADVRFSHLVAGLMPRGATEVQQRLRQTL
jgi:rSAM/selenodomain-associated transferase 1